jgi:hypothetical protein
VLTVENVWSVMSMGLKNKRKARNEKERKEKVARIK